MTPKPVRGRGKLQRRWRFPAEGAYIIRAEDMTSRAPLLRNIDEVKVHNGFRFDSIPDSDIRNNGEVGYFPFPPIFGAHMSSRLYPLIAQDVLKGNFSVTDVVPINSFSCVLPVDITELSDVIAEIMELRAPVCVHEFEKPFSLWPSLPLGSYREVAYNQLLQLPLWFRPSQDSSGFVHFTISRHGPLHGVASYVVDKTWMYATKNANYLNVKRMGGRRERIIITGKER